MMKTEILGVIAQIVLMVALSYPLGKYIAKVYKKEKTWLDFMKPVERLMFRLSGINPEEEMNWKQFLRALLTVNLFWFVWGMVLLVSQGYLPLNPDGNVFPAAYKFQFILHDVFDDKLVDIHALRHRRGQRVGKHLVTRVQVFMLLAVDKL